jgi:NRPS condensation-like uncharacterized protein
MKQTNYKHWEKLDNTANLFPVIAGEHMTNTYRISCELNEMIDPNLLQQALDRVLPRFPGFNLRLHTGFFWYYLEENGRPAPRVHEEDTYPCRLIQPNRNNHYLFRVTYYRKRINLEVFHAIADGMGGTTFLRELTYQYLRLAHPELKKALGDGLSDETSLNREDSFLRNFRKSSPPKYKLDKAMEISGEKLPYNGFGVMTGFMSVSQIKKVAKETYHTTINDYIVAAFIYATYRNFPDKAYQRPIRVAVPVNLRPYFNSNTTKNFFVMVSAEFRPDKDDYSFEEIVDLTSRSLKEQMTRENLEAIFSFNVSNQKILVARAVPLPLKNIAMKAFYQKSAHANTTTITNIGRVTVEDAYKPYISSFFCFLPFSTGQNLKAAITSYEDKLALVFSSALTDTSIERDVFRQLTKDGIDVEIETNGVF